MKSSKAWNDKKCEHANEDASRDRIFQREKTREECDDEEVYQFLFLLKRRNWLMADEADEI